MANQTVGSEPHDIQKLARSGPAGSCRHRHGGAGRPTSGGTEYLELNLNGTWSAPLTFGASGLPGGGSYTDAVLDENLTNGTWSSAAPPIPAGWSNGTGPLSVGPETIAEAYAVTTIPAGLKASSTLTVTFWASDGTTKQTESVPIDIKTSCARRY